MSEQRAEKLRHAVEMFYDVQKLRMQSQQRTKSLNVELDKKDQEFLDKLGENLKASEADALKQVKRWLKGVPIYEEWLKHQKGCGPTMAGVIVSSIDIHRAHTPSALWRYCGMAVDPRDGKAERRRKGEKTPYDPWLKAKLVRILAECLLRAGSDWRKFYDNYKHRKASAGWGESDGHRHNAAMRYMVKMFLLEMWRTWRHLEGLPTREPYQTAYLGHVHHGDAAE